MRSTNDDARPADHDRAIGRNVRILRESRSLGQHALGERLGLGIAAIGRIEKGGEKIDLPLIRNIAAALDTTPGRLIDGPVTARMLDLTDLDDQSAAALETLHAALSSR